MSYVYISSYIMQYAQKHKSIHMHKLEKNTDCLIPYTMIYYVIFKIHQLTSKDVVWTK